MLRNRQAWMVWMTLIFAAFVMGGCSDSDSPETPSDDESYDVSGVVVDDDDAGISGVSIEFGDAAAAVTTDSDGAWAQSDLTDRVEIRPVSDAYTFTPSSVTVDQATDDIRFVATPKDVVVDVEAYDVSGRVVDEHDIALEGVTLSLEPGEASVQTDADGLWHATELEGEVVITPSLTGYVFEPEKQTVSDAADDIHFVGRAVQPLQIDVSPQSYQLVPNGTVELTATLDGTFADNADVTWSLNPEEGALSTAEGTQVTYTAGNSPGTVEVTVTATTEEEQVSASAVIEVAELVVNIESSATHVGFGDTVELTAVVEGADAQNALYSWSATSGVLDGTTTSSVTWEAPQTLGTYNVSVVVQANNQNAQDSVAIEVQDPLCIGIENCEVIRTIQELQAMVPTGDRHYILGNDIHAAETETWNNNAGFEPIGSAAAPFDGTFDGNGFEIVGLHIHRPNTEGVGLFGETASGATIHDVTIKEWTVRGGDSTGALVGLNRGDILDVVVDDPTVEGAERVGGLVGQNNSLVQGVEGRVESVTGTEQVGGLVGFNRSRIEDFDVYVWRLTGEAEVGGIAGYNGSDAHPVFTSYATIANGALEVGNTNTTSGGDIGGIVGLNGTSSSIGGGIGGPIGPIDRGDAGDIHDVRVHLKGTFTLTEGSGGGAVGTHVSGTIERVSVVSDHAAQGVIQQHGQATGPTRLGGFVGLSAGTIRESFVVSSFVFGVVVGGSPQAPYSTGGGFVGLLNGGRIEDSYVIANTTAQTRMSGGFAGEIGANGLLQRVYAKVKNSALTNQVQSAGGLVGKNDRNDAVAFSYWDKESSGLEDSAAGTGLTTTQMERSMSYSSWDKQNVWMMMNADDNLPDLRNNPRD